MDVPTVIRKTRRLFGDDNGVIIDDDDIIDWINEAQLRIARETGCLIANTSGDANTFPLSFPSDFLRSRRIIYGTKALQEISLDDMDRRELDVTAYSDTPSFFYFNENKFHLFPVPSSSDTTTVYITYNKTPTVITTTANPLTIPAEYHEDIVRLCVARAHDRNENYRASETAKQEYDRLASARLDGEYDKDDTYPVVRDDPWEEW